MAHARQVQVHPGTGTTPPLLASETKAVYKQRGSDASAAEVGVDDRTHELLREVGLTTNEARAYLALLRSNPGTGYEVAASSDVPRSAIYTVLRSLETRGLVNLLPGQPARYVPLDPRRFVELQRGRQARTLDELQVGLAAVASAPADAPTWTLRGYGPVLDQARALVDGALRTVYASLWRREADGLAEPLRRAAARGVRIVLFSFTGLPDVGTALSYGIDEAELERYWTHGLILVADGARALVGGAERTEANRAVVTEDEALLGVARSNLVLDITLYGQRTGRDVAGHVLGLAGHLAPVEELLDRATRR